MGIGSNIRKFRQRRGITQETLAAMLGVTPSAVGNYEHDVSFPKEEVLMKLFGALECTPNELLGAEGGLTRIECAHLKKYRSLDERGRMLVDACTDAELERMETEEIPIAARKGSPGEPLKLKRRNGKSLLDAPDYKGGRK